eukprot:scaffold141366_cov28-Prasinocladus_malaysianus.AAC.1
MDANHIKLVYGVMADGLSPMGQSSHCGRCQLLLTAVAAPSEPGGLQAALALQRPPVLWCSLELEQRPQPSGLQLYLDGKPLECSK